MKTFAERNPIVIGAIGCAVTVGIMVGATQYDKLPFFSGGQVYTAYLAEAGGLRSGAAVQVFGARAGQVSSIKLDGPRVLITFDVSKDIQLGDRTEAAVKTKSLLGTKILEVTPRGDGELSGAIPLDRTTPAYQLPDALGDLTATISGLNTDQVSESLSTLADTFAETPPELRAAVSGVARFSEAIDARDAQLRTLLSNVNKVTAVLSERSEQIVNLISNTNALMAELQNESAALRTVSANISALSQQLSGLVADNRAQLRGALDKLNGVLTIVDNRKERVQASIKMLNSYVTSLGEAVSAGPFFKAYVANLLPGQFIQPFVDAAFSDLGLDPNVLLPSERTDPEVGQPGTPGLPLPFPRTGQGGEPKLTLPEAITGNPGDPRYPYDPPLPQPAPGGPPPGPPAGYVPDPAPTEATP
jgi:phospholipid/cholesterol/gamma-HCH transport system substrate-binding protein